jgi:hypothetical protein
VADGASLSDADWIDTEAARWVWRRIPPHLGQCVALTAQLIDDLDTLGDVPLSQVEGRINEIVQLAYRAHNEAGTAGTMYRCIAEWLGWTNDERGRAEHSDG